jgi:hypothetical protein
MPRRSDKRVVIFAGPTLATSECARSLARPFRLRPPVARTDVAKLVNRATEVGVLVIVDGLFHERLAVGHAELRDAIEQGWQVWGVSSMGAIRAREMERFGMRGFGRVFDRFRAEEDFQDDEVALLHEAAPPYRPLTEPLVHMRVAIDHLVERGLVNRRSANTVVNDLKSSWFGDRTLRRFTDMLLRGATSDAEASAAIRSELLDFARFRVKTTDLEDFLRERPWVLDGAE